MPKAGGDRSSRTFAKQMSHFFKRYSTAFLLCLFVFSVSEVIAEDISDQELRATFASLNQKYLQEVFQRNPQLSLYSLLPLEKSTDNARFFLATFLTPGSKQITLMFHYIRVNNVWQRRDHITDLSDTQESNNK